MRSGCSAAVATRAGTRSAKSRVGRERRFIKGWTSQAGEFVGISVIKVSSFKVPMSLHWLEGARGRIKSDRPSGSKACPCGATPMALQAKHHRDRVPDRDPWAARQEKGSRETPAARD